MIVISHRGNLQGPDTKTENTKAQIVKVLEMGFPCEVDVWGVSGLLAMGHDEPKEDAILNSNIIYHCKNLEAANYCHKLRLHYFMHDRDEAALTSMGYMWTRPGSQVYKNSIICLSGFSVLHWVNDGDLPYGICTDYPLKFTNGSHLS